MAREVLTAGGDGGFAKRTFSRDWVSETSRQGPIGLVREFLRSWN